MSAPHGSHAGDRGRLRVAISGATGMLGAPLAAALRADGHEVHALSRRKTAAPGEVRWDPAMGTIDAAALDGMDAVVHLAGAPLAERWTAERKRAIRDSRVVGTEMLARALAGLARPPRVLLSGSAIGIYGDRGDELLDESSKPGGDWLARVATEWEAAARPVIAAGTRLVLLRMGVVLSASGGALARMLPPFRLGVGGPLGSGEQWMSWIALGDAVRAMRFLIEADAVSGAVNVVAPNAVRNAEFAKTLGRVLGRPALLPVPALALELLFGEMARATILASQRVRAGVLSGAGFAFSCETAEAALRSVLGR